MESIETLNRRLKEVYGVDLLRRPFFQLVWSADQVEKRFGEFSVYYGSIFVRKTVGFEDAKKYAYINPPAYVLERLLWIPEGMDKEICPQGPDRATYEPVWAFHGVLPVWDAIQVIIHSMRNPHKKSPSDIREEKEKAFEDEIKHFQEILDNEQPELANALEHGTAVSFAGVEKYEGNDS